MVGNKKKWVVCYYNHGRGCYHPVEDNPTCDCPCHKRKKTEQEEGEKDGKK